MSEDNKLDPRPGSAPEPEETPEEQQPPSPARSRSVFLYLAVLFGVAFLLLLFAYLMQQRDSSDLRDFMGSIQSIDQLLEENRGLRAEIESLETELAGLENTRQQQSGEITALQEQIEADKAALEAAQARVQELEAELKALQEETAPPDGGEE